MSAWRPEAPDWRALHPVMVQTGAVVGQGVHEVLLSTTAGPLSVSLHVQGARIRMGERRELDYAMLVAEPEPLGCTVSVEEGATVVAAGALELRVGHGPLSFTLSRDGRAVVGPPSDGHFVRERRVPAVARTPEGWFLAFALGSDEPVYGLGEKWGRLDKRGQLVRSWNEDALGVNAEVSYKNAPFAWSPHGWGVFVHTPSAVTHGVGYAPWSQRSYGLLVEDAELDLFLLTGGDGAAQLRDYTDLTGRAPVPPAFSLGVILSKAYYRDADELLSAAREVRARGMPCDTITLDGRAWQDTDTRFAFEWDAARYPDPAAVIGELKAMNFRVCVWEYPLVSVLNPLFAQMAAKGWLLTDRRTGRAYEYDWAQEAFGAVLTPLPRSGLVDFTHPEAFAFWRDQHEALFALGVDMIKADFGEQVEDDAHAYNGEHGRALHNVYALLYNRCVHEGASRYARDGAFLFSRDAWTGSQRYPSPWGGDPQADWEGMIGDIRGGLSLGLSGFPYYATDVGGFYKDRRDPALFVRWCQAAVFSAHMRLHGIGPREPWSYGAQAEAAAMEALRLRYRLLPYLHAAMQESADTGLPVQRPMALAFPQERAAWAFESQFMFGSDLLVAPCFRPDARVELYLPAGRWRRFPTGETFEGARTHSLTLALEETAVFAREGAAIPLGPDVTHTGELGGAWLVARTWFG